MRRLTQLESLPPQGGGRMSITVRRLPLLGYPQPAYRAGPIPTATPAYQAELRRQVWGGVRDSNSFGQLGRLEHNPYANPAKVVDRAERSISIFHSETDSVPLPRQEARGVPTRRPGTAILCPAHPWRIRFRRACSGRRRWLRYGADSRLRTGDLHLGKVSFCQLNYVRKSGGSYPPPDDHIPELLRSYWLALSPATGSYVESVSIWWGVQVTILASQGIGFTDRSASLAEYHPRCSQLQGPKSKEPGLLSLIRAPWSGTVIF